MLKWLVPLLTKQIIHSSWLLRFRIYLNDKRAQTQTLVWINANSEATLSEWGQQRAHINEAAKMPKVLVVQPNQGKKQIFLPKKRTHLIWTIGNSRKETAKRLNQINNNFYFSLPFPPMVPPSSPLCLTKGEETLPNNTNLSCKVCTFSLCCVPFTSENSLQVKFSQILNEWTQTADHRALQGGYTWQRAAAWGTRKHKHGVFTGRSTQALQ